jgi:hypothetical protein
LGFLWPYLTAFRAYIKLAITTSEVFLSFNIYFEITVQRSKEKQESNAHQQTQILDLPNSVVCHSYHKNNVQILIINLLVKATSTAPLGVGSVEGPMLSSPAFS